MIKKLKKRLNSRKVKIFSLFLLCAILAWFVSNLSEKYTAKTQFNLNYVNVPDSLFFTNELQKDVQVKLYAKGFQFLRLNFFVKEINVDLSEVENKKENYFLKQSIFKKQIERQLSNSVSLIEVGVKDTFFVKLYKLYKKEVPIKSRLTVSLKQNHVLEEGLKISPSTITVSGPKEEIDSINSIDTENYDLVDIATNFEKKVPLILPLELKNSKFSNKYVIVSGQVFRFSEKEIELPIKVINLSADMNIRTFPSKVSVFCKAKVNVLKEISASDFDLIADFNDYKIKGLSTLRLELVKKPKEIYSVKLNEEEVEFILHRK